MKAPPKLKGSDVIRFNTLTQRYGEACRGLEKPGLSEGEKQTLTEARDAALERILHRRSKSVRQIAAKVIIARDAVKQQSHDVAETMLDSAISDLAAASA